MKVKNIISFIMECYFLVTMKSNAKLIRSILKENPQFKRLNRKGFVFKVDLRTLNFRIDNQSIKANNFRVTTVKDLLLLHHENYYKNNPAFKVIQNIKIVPFIKYDYDISFLYIICFSERDYNLLRTNLLNIKSFKYKAVFNKEERKIVYGMKNGFTKYYKYSYNFNYLLELQDNILETEKRIKTTKEENESINEIYEAKNKLLNDLLYYDKFNYSSIGNLKAIKFLRSELERLSNAHYNNLILIDELKEDLQELNNLYDKLTYSISEE